jgi:excisionase family DNA binding protein
MAVKKTKGGTRPPHPDAPLLTLQEAAFMLCCSKRTVQRRIDQGELDTVFGGALLRVTRASVQAFIERETSRGGARHAA